MFKFKIPHNIVIVFSIILIASVLTWIVPGGKYERKMVNINGTERSVIVDNSFKYVENQPQTWHVFSAFYSGFIKMSKIIVFILILGGAFWIVNETKAIDTGILSFVGFTKKFETNSLIKKLGVNNIVMSLIMILFSIFGAVFGMSEETLAFTVIFIQLSISMGYDSLVGVGLCYFAAHIGFAGAIINPFTLGIAQDIAQLPQGSGFAYRVLCWAILTFLGIIFILWYARKVKKNPQKSIVYEDDNYWRGKAAEKIETTENFTPKIAWLVAGVLTVVMCIFAYRNPFSTISFDPSSPAMSIGPILPILTGLFVIFSIYSLRKSFQYFVLTIFGFTILYLVVGSLSYQWGLAEISALFLAMGVSTGIAANKTNTQVTKLFVEGAKDIVSVVLVAGFAGGIIVTLENGQIIDTILHSVVDLLNGAGQLAAVSIMYLFQSTLNLIITSGSAKALLTMPLMAPLAEPLEISRQSIVMAFQLGAGFTDIISPTSGVLVGVLGISRISYGKWVKWILPFLIFLMLVGWLLLVPTVFMKINGF